MEITQFKGESRRDAIVNHFGLDIEEEDSFFDFIEEMGYNVDTIDDEILIPIYNMFINPKR